MKELLDISNALQNLNAEPCALATVINVQGSSYRRPGARMLLTSKGRSWGMISGGCLEHDVIANARKALHSGQARIVRYDSTSSDDIIFGTGLGCNGIVDVFIEPVTQDYRQTFIQAVESCNQTRLRGGLATLIANQDGLTSSWEHAYLAHGKWTGKAALITYLNASDTKTETSRLVELRNSRVFIQPLLPPVHLVVFGSGLDVVPLVRIGKEVGFRVTVVDARRRATSPELFCEADSVLISSPEDAVASLNIDRRTAVVLMAHHFERDQEALTALVQQTPFYIGMLGPKRRQAKLLSALETDNIELSDQFAGNLYGPAGLDLGGNSPEIIALSIIAEIQARLANKSTGPLRDRASRDENQPVCTNLKVSVPA